MSGDFRPSEQIFPETNRWVPLMVQWLARLTFSRKFDRRVADSRLALCDVSCCFLRQGKYLLTVSFHPGVGTYCWGSPAIRGTQRENFSKILEISFSAKVLRSFQSFLKAYLCQLNRFLSWKFRPQKILGNRILSAEFPSCWWLSENASWPYFAL